MKEGNPDLYIATDIEDPKNLSQYHWKTTEDTMQECMYISYQELKNQNTSFTKFYIAVMSGDANYGASFRLRYYFSSEPVLDLG